jgi:hypothetical protein
MGREVLFAEVEEELCPLMLTAYSMSEASSTICHDEAKTIPPRSGISQWVARWRGPWSGCSTTMGLHFLQRASGGWP